MLPILIANIYIVADIVLLFWVNSNMKINYGYSIPMISTLNSISEYLFRVIR